MKRTSILFIAFSIAMTLMTSWLSITVSAQRNSTQSTGKHGIGLFAPYKNESLVVDHDFEVGDVDNDGDLDIVNMYHVLFNNGHAIFTQGGSLNNSWSEHIALGDIDSDNDLDAIVIRSVSFNSQIWINDGHGNFTKNTKQELTTGGDDVAVADLNGDTYLDIFFEGEQRSPSEIWLNDGNGKFILLSQPLQGKNIDSNGIALGDLDGDGDLDVFVSASSYEGSQVLLNDGGAIFSNTNQVLDYGIRAGDIALGDLDGDNDLDAFIANVDQSDEYQPNKVWLNDGHGHFTDSGQLLGDSASRGVDLADIDADGDLDAYVVNDDANEVWLNDGNGHFTDSGQRHEGYLGIHVRFADLDNDSDPDVVVYTGSPIWLNILPITNLKAFNDSPTTFGEITHLTATIKSGEFVNYLWDFGRNMTSTTRITSNQFWHNNPTTETITVTVSAINPVSVVTTTTAVTISPSPFINSAYLPFLDKSP